MDNVPKVVNLPFALKLLRKLQLPHKYGVLDKLFGRRLAGSEVAWIECANGITWKLDLRNPTHRWCVYDSIFVPEVATWMRHHLSAGGIVIDSGANIGQAVIEFASNPLCYVHAFEPLPEAYTWLDESISRAEFKNVKIIRKGLYSSDTELELQVAGKGDVHGAHSTLRQDWYTSQNNERLLIQLTTLDHYAQTLGIDSIRLWKLDVEGSELEALKGAKSLLESKSIQALYIEINNPEQTAVPEYLSGMGYIPMKIQSRGNTRELTGGISHAGDYLFIPS